MSSYPTIGAVREVTDSAQSHTNWGDFNPEATPGTYSGPDSVHFVYHTGTSAPDSVWMRRWDRLKQAFEPPVKVDDKGYAGENYHGRPCVLADANGGVYALVQDRADQDEYIGTYALPPRLRSVPRGKLEDLPVLGPVTGVRSRVLNTFAQGSVQYVGMSDVSHIVDVDRGKTFAVGEMNGIGPLDGVATQYGAPRGAFFIGPDGQFGYPYCLVRAENNIPQPIGSGVTGQSFCKGDVVLERLKTGKTRWHFNWETRVTFKFPLSSDPYRLWNYNIYYAYSDDAGLTWKNHDGSATVAITTSIFYSDSRFLVYQGDVQQYSSRTMAIDPTTGKPVWVIGVPQAGQSAKNITVGSATHVDWDQAPTMHLALLKWNGSAFALTSPIVHPTYDWLYQRPKLFVNQLGEYFLILGGPAQVRKSTDGGLTWGGSTALGFINDNWRIHAAPCPYDEHLILLVSEDSSSHRMYFSEMRIGDKISVSRRGRLLRAGSGRRGGVPQPVAIVAPPWISDSEFDESVDDLTVVYGP